MWVQTSSVTYLADWSQDHLPHYHDETLVTGAHQEIESHVDIMYRVLMILPALGIFFVRLFQSSKPFAGKREASTLMNHY